MHPFAPDDPESTTWDVVVVGTGMGGASAGFALARRGHRVLFLERGLFLFGDAERGDGRMPVEPEERPESRLERGWWPFPLEGRTDGSDQKFFAPWGCGSGGTTGLYAAQLERLHPTDFAPRANHPDAADSTLPDSWPITYEDLLPYYRQAEELFRVRGTPDPLQPDPDAPLREAPALSPRDQDFLESFRELGLHPYRAHVAYEFVPGCEECGGALCPRACKNDAGKICLLPALEQHGARILAECHVLSLEADESSVRRIRCRWRDKERSIRARVVVLAAGAFMTPALLLRSKSPAWPEGLANGSGAVGRNLMLHAGDFIAVRPRRALSAAGPRKALALNDFYRCEEGKLGTFQSVGIAIEWGYVLFYLRSTMEKSSPLLRKLAGPFLRVVAHAAAAYFKSSAVFATILEDLPYWENRVVPAADSPNGMRFEYRYPDELRRRNQRFRRRLKRALGPHHRTMVLSPPGTLNFGHVCGTCRFGTDPRTSVLDRTNRAHEVENLYVVDASFFPSSGGTNPTLTIAANALRVADAIHEKLPQPATRG